VERVLPDGIEQALRDGCRLAGRADADERVAEMKGPAKDLFGSTKDCTTLGELLRSLPEPRTLITDLYIVDHFPELAEIGFEPVEYLPPGL